jgi:activator of HSP90 ATPase
MAYAFEVTGEIQASCEEVYLAWLSSELHTAMTGGEAVVDPVVGGQFSAWGDYIAGQTIELEPFHRIVQSWRTTQFNDDDPDSQIDVTFDPSDSGTLMTIRHTNVPDGHLGYENGGWQKSYIDPMRSYFSSK